MHYPEVVVMPMVAVSEPVQVVQRFKMIFELWVLGLGAVTKKNVIHLQTQYFPLFVFGSQKFQMILAG